MNTDLMFSSKKQDWATPQNLFDDLNKEFRFDLDVCAHELNHKCDSYYSEEDNALEQKWMGDCFMNPPYDQCAEFIKKAYEESLHGSRVCCLIPSRTDTRYFHDYCMKADEIRFIKGRLKFGDGANSAPFPSALIIFNNNNKLNPTISTYTNQNIESKPKKVLYNECINPLKYIYD